MAKMACFFDLFPLEARQELEFLQVDGRSYPMIEFYCIDPACDCRRLMVNVYPDLSLEEPLAIITYGWDSLAFYEKWLPGYDPVETKGPALEFYSPHTELAHRILERFKERLKEYPLDAIFARHYQAVKAELKKQQARVLPSSLVGRNDPCPCGSGKKAKKCCGVN